MAARHTGTSPPSAGVPPTPRPPPPPPPRPFAFRSSAGHMLQGTLVEAPPPSAGAPAAVAILLHGLNSHRDDCILPALADGLADAGVGSLRFDAAGCGGSGGPFRFANYAEEAADVALAVRALEEGSPRRRVVAVAGHSKAGTVAVLAAGSTRTPLCISLAGRFHLDTGLESRFGPDLEEKLAAAGPAGIPVTWKRGGPEKREAFTWFLSLADLAARRGPRAVDVAAACRALPSSTRLLHVHGTADAVVPVREAGAYGRATAHCDVSEVVLVEGGDHNFTGPAAAAAAVAAVVDFVARHRPQ